MDMLFDSELSIFGRNAVICVRLDIYVHCILQMQCCYAIFMKYSLLFHAASK